MGGFYFGIYNLFKVNIANDIATRMILAGADPDAVTVCDTDDMEQIFSTLEKIDTKVIYVLTNPKHAPVVKGYLLKGGAVYA